MEDTAESLEQRQDALQAEVRQVESDLRLDSLLEQVGRPVRVGSAALGLMVWRDLDITVICAKLDIGPVTKIGATLGSHPRIREVLFRDDTGSWNTDPAYPDGVYLGIAYRAPSGDDWKIDIWFVDEPERQPDLAHLQSIPTSTRRLSTTVCARSISSMNGSQPNPDQLRPDSEAAAGNEAGTLGWPTEHRPTEHRWPSMR